MERTISTQIQLTILKPVEEVFNAAAQPVPFFVQETSGPLVEGKTIEWKFPEFPMVIPVRVRKVEPYKLIRFEWDSSFGKPNTCEFAFGRPQDENPGAKPAGPATTLSIRESGWPDDAKGQEAARRNTMGWMHMACALKAYLEYGVNLRQGSFLHMKF